MHQRTRLRKFVLALAGPAAAIGGLAFQAHGIYGSQASPTSQVRVAATSQATPQQQATGGATSAPGATTSSGSATASPSTSASPSATATPSASGSATILPGIPASPGSPGATGAPVQNCLKKPVPTPVTVKIADVGGKQALVDGDGCALYVDTQDTPGASPVNPAGLAVFPPARGPAQAGTGVTQANLGTFTRSDGTIQATYFGHQLYYYTLDNQPGVAKGQGVNQTWFIIGPTGNTITS